MKRILALFLVFILIFSITACGMNTSEKPYDGETMSGTEENSNVSTEEMLSDVPDTYDYALQVSINPEFILYLVGSEVVAFGTEAVANELLKEAEDCGISVNPVITIEENLNFSENTKAVSLFETLFPEALESQKVHLRQENIREYVLFKSHQQKC